MRFFMYMAFFIGFLPLSAMAQTYYIAPSGASSAGTIYNAPSGGYVSSAPINLKGMIRGSSTKSTGSSYNNTTYGRNRAHYSLALSPQEVEQYQRNRIREQEKREQERQARTQQAVYDTQKETQGYLNKLQSSDKSSEKKAEPRKKVLYYNQGREPLAIPKRVFNTPY